MTLKTISIFCASILVGCVVGKTKHGSPQLSTDQGNDENKGTIRFARYSPYYYGNYANENGYASQGTYQDANGYPLVQDNGYEQPNRNPGYISGQVRPGETVSIGNGRGHNNVVAINSAGDTDYYVGYTDGGVNRNTGSGQVYPSKNGQSGIIVNKKPGGQEDVLLWNANGNRHSSIGVNQDGAALYSGNNYQSTYQTHQNNKPINQGYGKPVGRNSYESSSIYSQQDQVYLNSQRYY